LEFLEPAGAFSGKLLPTGVPRETVTLDDGRNFTVSIVDAGNVVVFCIPEELGLRGDELPADLETNPDAIMTLEAIRSIVAERLGIVSRRSIATAVSPGLPKIGFVSPPRSYETSSGRHVSENEIDIIGRLMTMQTPHHAYMGGGAISTGAAAMTEGTVVHAICPPRVRETGIVRIGHPSGIMDVSVKTSREKGDCHIKSIIIYRTARRIMEGVAFVSETSFAETS
jgi:hypothetical protein